MNDALSKLSNQAFSDLEPLMGHEMWPLVHLSQNHQEGYCTNVSFFWVYGGWNLEIEYDADEPDIWVSAGNYVAHVIRLPEGDPPNHEGIFTKDVNEVLTIAKERLDWFQKIKYRNKEDG